MEYRRRHDRHHPRGWFSLFVRLGGWVALALGVGLFAMTLFSASFLYLADRMDGDGKFTRAVVTDKRLVVSVDSDGDEARDYIVTFTYKSSEGGQTAVAEVGVAYFGDVEIGDERVIRYLRSDPGRIEYDIGAYRRSGVLLRWVAFGIGLAGLATLWLFGQRANRAVRARRDGEKRMAEVTGIRRLSVEVNNRRQARLQWREPDGQEGESLMRDMAELSRMYGAGDPVVVFRLGKHAYWEGDVGPPRREVE